MVDGRTLPLVRGGFDPAGPQLFPQATEKSLAEVRDGTKFGRIATERKVFFSLDDGKAIPFLFTPGDLMMVVDVDQKHFSPGPDLVRRILGWCVTRSGHVHLWVSLVTFDSDPLFAFAATNMQDASYANMSVFRGGWSERLVPPTAIHECAGGPEFQAHRNAMVIAWNRFERKHPLVRKVKP